MREFDAGKEARYGQEAYAEFGQGSTSRRARIISGEASRHPEKRQVKG
jgi:hypothetical protein